MGMQMQPFFLDSPRGKLFCLLRAPAVGSITRGMLYLHPFAEEMHKSRRMAAVLARALAADGWAVLQVDLTGCGDSAGDFSDASWTAWRQDTALAWALLERISPRVPHSLWGLRLGATLAAQMSAELTSVAGLMLWQPVVSGELFLNQFLRIRLAGEMLSEGKAQSDTRHLRARLDQGESIEVGGYGLSSAMARELAGVRLADTRPPCPVAWMEVGAKTGDDIAPAGRRVVEAWRQEGTSVSTCTVAGASFWLTQEITECPALVESTMRYLAK